MPKPKPVLNPLSAFYKSHLIDAVLYGFVSGIRLKNPDIEVKEIILTFISVFDSDATFEPSELQQTYYRMHNKFKKK